MLTRRLALILALLTPLPGLAPRAALAALTPEQATAFVQSTGNQLLAVINGPGDAASKAKRLQPIIDAAVDVDEVGRFCLGRFWRLATPAQRAEYLKLFHIVLLNGVAGKLGQYTGVKFTIGRTSPRPDAVVVQTVVERPDNAPNNVGWVIADVGGTPKIVDVIAEGTSLRVTQRSDYDSYLSRNGNSVDALIDAMRAQIAKYGE